jgi:outer membrane protein assembly factor BamB
MWDIDNNFCIEHFQNKRIEIFEDKTYEYNSNNNLNKYSFEYLSEIIENDGFDNYSSKFGIVVKENYKIINSAIILASGGYAGPPGEGRYVIEDNFLIICCGDTLFSISLSELKLNWKVKIDDVTAFDINKMNNDYIIRGELAISRINKDGKIIWQKYGSDIFVRIDDKFYFEIIDNNIFTISWDGRKYKFNYDDGEDEYNKSRKNNMVPLDLLDENDEYIKI